MDRPAGRALLLVDYMNRFDFPHSGKVARRAAAASHRAAHLKALAKAAKVPCIYANDNFGHWESEFSALVERCLAAEGPPREIAAALRPEKGDLSILKPRNSAFYGTPLEFLLDELDVGSLILAGVSTDICVSATAQDAHTRKFRLWIPADCSAADTEDHEREALDQMQRTLGADIRPAAGLEALEQKPSG